MAYDLLIKNGTVVDGTGAPRFRADVAIAGNVSRKSAKSPNPRSALSTLRILIVAPGFIDPHTHYDAQICWDPLVTCTSWHGMTSVVMGNCGVGIAPCKPEVREVAAWDLVNVEAIPYDSLNKGHHLGLGNVPAIHGRGAEARQRRSTSASSRRSRRFVIS